MNDILVAPTGFWFNVICKLNSPDWAEKINQQAH